jgi:hypothetical protein
MGCGPLRSKPRKILMFFARSVWWLQALEVVLTVTMRAIAQISFSSSGFTNYLEQEVQKSGE